MKKLFRIHVGRTWNEAFLLQIRKCIKQKKALFNCVEDWSWAIWDFNESGIWSTNTLIFQLRNILLLSFFGRNAVPYVNSKNTTLKSCCQNSFPLKQHVTNRHFYYPKLRLCVIMHFNYVVELMWRTLRDRFAQGSQSICRAVLSSAHLLCQLIRAAPHMVTLHSEQRLSV